jgi:GT2 family glycosyltransferase
MTAEPRICVCVPARDEAERLPSLIAALAAQDWPGRLPVAIALNNTTDGSRDVLDALGARHSRAIDLTIDDHVFPAHLAHAGSARRRAMDLGLDVVGSDDRAILLTTDADARPPIDWVRRNVEAVGRGADLVGGALALDEDEPISDLVRARWTALAAYWRAVRGVEDEIDPISWDPPPRHGDHTGGSLAITVAAYRAAGGVPALPLREDAALVTAARAKGFKVAHPSDVWTRVSPRTAARAQGGMSAVMAALAGPDGSAMRVPSLEQWRERARWRRSVRLEGGDPRVAALEPALPQMVCDVEIKPVFAEVAA